MRDKHAYSNEEVLSIERRVVWLRHPISRLQSGYSFHYYCTRNSISVSGVKGGVPVDTWENFIDYTLLHENLHWCQQVEALSIDGEYLATETHKFEDISTKWSDVLPGLIPWMNACSHRSITEYRTDELNKKYEKDLSLWHSL